jgi:RimJ/RimL family protein N-acetyltransferase
LRNPEKTEKPWFANAFHRFNEASAKLRECLGFQQEGRVRRVVLARGQCFDELIYGLTKEEFVAEHVHILL